MDHAAPAAQIHIDTKRLKQSDVEAALDVFKQTCSPLNRHWSDVASLSVTVRDEVADYRIRNGWAVNIHVAVVLKDRLRGLPNVDSRAGVIAGHTLHYDLGGGRVPGMMASKRVSQLLCGMYLSDKGADIFMPISELDFLKY